MKNWKNLLLEKNAPIRKAIEVIDSGGAQIALVVSSELQLLGTITDGDIRRGLLKGFTLDASVDSVMNKSPRVLPQGTPKAKAFELMKERLLRQVPIVDSNGILVGIETLHDFLNTSSFPNRVVLMAGGRGQRLFPLTKDCPKPLLKVGSKPILKIIIENFIAQGFRDFFLSVNYKAEMVEDYFKDGKHLEANIKYLKEKEVLGTAGALSLLPDDLTDPIIVMNGDLLTKVNFSQLLEFHNQNKSEVTVCVREYEFQVPYGVLHIENEHILKVEEKPAQSFFVNGGIYVFNPEVLRNFDSHSYIDMPELLNQLLSQGKKVSAFPLREYWLDIGQSDDLERAHGEYFREFSEHEKDRPQ